jgi:hypothetical protein
MIDALDDAQQPRCPHCGTVLRDDRGGYWCAGCDIVTVRTGL